MFVYEKMLCQEPGCGTKFFGDLEDACPKCGSYRIDKMYHPGEILSSAKELLEEAKRVSNREEHAEFWNRKVRVLRKVNSALESGLYSGEAQEELLQASFYINQAEIEAGKYE